MLYRIISAIRKHIVPEEALADTCVAVSVQESPERGVIISALQVIEARLHKELISAVKKKTDKKLEKPGKKKSEKSQDDIRRDSHFYSPR